MREANEVVQISSPDGGRAGVQSPWREMHTVFTTRRWGACLVKYLESAGEHGGYSGVVLPVFAVLTRLVEFYADEMVRWEGWKRMVRNASRRGWW